METSSLCFVGNGEPQKTFEQKNSVTKKGAFQRLVGRLAKMVNEWEQGDQLGSHVGTLLLAAAAMSGPFSKGPSPYLYFTDGSERDEAELGLEPEFVQKVCS